MQAHVYYRVDRNEAEKPDITQASLNHLLVHCLLHGCPCHHLWRLLQTWRTWSFLAGTWNRALATHIEHDSFSLVALWGFWPLDPRQRGQGTQVAQLDPDRKLQPIKWPAIRVYRGTFALHLHKLSQNVRLVPNSKFWPPLEQHAPPQTRVVDQPLNRLNSNFVQGTRHLRLLFRQHRSAGPICCLQ